MAKTKNGGSIRPAPSGPDPGTRAPPPMSGAELRSWREQIGFSQRKLAPMLGVSRRILQMWEDGSQEVPPLMRWLVQITHELRIAKGISGWTQGAFLREVEAALGYASTPWYLNPEPPKRNETEQPDPSQQYHPGPRPTPEPEDEGP